MMSRRSRDEIAIDGSDEITEGSQPRLAAIPLTLGAPLGI